MQPSLLLYHSVYLPFPLLCFAFFSLTLGNFLFFPLLHLCGVQWWGPVRKQICIALHLAVFLTFPSSLPIAVTTYKFSQGSLMVFFQTSYLPVGFIAHCNLEVIMVWLEDLYVYSSFFPFPFPLLAWSSLLGCLAVQFMTPIQGLWRTRQCCCGESKSLFPMYIDSCLLFLCSLVQTLN